MKNGVWTRTVVAVLFLSALVACVALSDACAADAKPGWQAEWEKTLAAAIADRDLGTEALIRIQRARRLADAPNPDWAEIAADLERGAALNEQIGARPREARARLELATALDQLGRTAEATASRARAHDLFRDMGLASPVA